VRLILSALLVTLGVAPVSQPAPQPVPFKTLESGTQSDIEQPREAVARTAEEWKALCTAHQGGRPCPRVDIARATVIGVFLGTRPTAGFSVEIARIDRDGDALVVTYREHAPAADQMVAQMITMPFQLVTIDRFAGPIRFARLK